jgi:hypothetical protein
MIENIRLDGWSYKLDVFRQTQTGPDTVKILIPAYQPNDTASAILKVCIEAVKKFTPPSEYELWVVDNNSSLDRSEWLKNVKDINVILNLTEPRPQEERTILKKMAFWRNQTMWGSYANAVGLELVAKLLPSDTRFVMTLHMDTMPCHPNWLGFLKTKINEHTSAAGICMERLRVPEGVLHILGCLFEYSEARKRNLDFFPDLPKLDVGDKITVGFRGTGKKVFVCRNTYENPEYVEHILVDSQFRKINVVRAFDDDWNVIFMHLGRGIPKAGQRYSGKTSSAEDWLTFWSNIIK